LTENGARESICGRVTGKKAFRGRAKWEDYTAHGFERGIEAPDR